ncbi:MAG TPA: hypothetical protein VJ732_12410, partial [Bryobacteraceae bacterium]|nr:hypothetical protein [Bryobacteraceae bacterium]
MRHLIPLALLPGLVLAGAGCKRAKLRPRPTDESGASIASTIHTGDPKLAAQLISGFYQIEQGAWRWTGRQFTVVLHPPLGAAQNGARLEMDFTVPPVSIEKLGAQTLSATMNGV